MTDRGNLWIAKRAWPPITLAVSVFALSALLASCAPAAWGSYVGTLDPSFGRSGITVAQPVPGSTNVGDSLALQHDGRVVVGAYASAEPSNGNAPSTAMVARLLPNGALDPSFGRGGYVVLSGVGGFAPSPVPFDERSSITPVRLKVLLSGDGHILVLGSALVRLNSDGGFDLTFGSSGTAQLPSGFTAAGMALAPTGAIVLVGDERLPDGAAGAVVRLTSEGTPDPTFGSNGGMVVLPRVADARGRVVSALNYRGVAVAGDGSITVAGVGRASSEPFAPRDGLLARLSPEGSLDPSFGREGQTLLERTGLPTIDSFEPNTLILAGDGSVLVGTASCVTFKYGPCDADVDGFASDGHPTHVSSEVAGCSPGLCEQAVTLTPLPDGGLLGAAWEGELLLDRLDTNLNRVQSFGTSDAGSDQFGPGFALAQLPAGSQTSGNVLVLPNGEIVVAGSLPAAGGGRALLVARLFGLRPPPRPRLSVPNRRVRAGQRSVSVLLDCHPYVSCSGKAVLRGRRAILASGPFDVASNGSGLVVMPITRAGRRILRDARLTAATLTLSMAKATVVAVKVQVPRPPALDHRMVAPGALEPLASDVTAFDGDGRRYVLFIQGSTLRVLDTLTQREYPARVPAGCVDTAQRALSFPMVLLSCKARDVLVDVTDRRVRPLPNTTVNYNWGNIGRVWIGPTGAAGCPNLYVCNEYLDWHTDAVRRINTPPAPQPVMGPLNEVLARNLDSADLTPVADCPPFQPTNLDQSLVAYPRLYEPPYLLYGQAIEPFNGGPPQTAPGLWLGRCGTTATTALDTGAARLHEQPGEPGDQVGAGIVSWYSPADTTVSLYEIRQQRRLTWAAPGARTDSSNPAAIVHTRYAAIVATAAHQICEGTCHTDSWTLYQAQLR